MTTQTAPESITTTYGSTGLTQYSGRIHEEYLRELMGPRWHRALKRMCDDPLISAALLAIEMLLRQVTWDVVPVGEDAPAVAAADLIRSAWLDMSETWPDTLAEILTMIPHGWAYLELIYKRRAGQVYREDGSLNAEQSSQYNDGRIGWACWSIRSQDTLDRWEFDPDDGSLRGLWQIAPPTYANQFIPIEKALHLKTTSRKGSPEGRSILRGTYRPWYFKQNIENIEGVGIERDLAGFPVVTIPAAVINAGGSVLTQYHQLARDIKIDEQMGVVIPSDVYAGTNVPMYGLSLLSSTSRRQFDTNAIIGRYDARIAMTMLADVILLGHEKVGSFALSSDKTDLLGVALGAYLETISIGVQQQAFRRLLALNGIDPTLCPTLHHGDIESADLAETGAYLESLTKSGMKLFPDPALETYLKEQAGWPVPEESATEDSEALDPPEEETQAQGATP